MVLAARSVTVALVTLELHRAAAIGRLGLCKGASPTKKKRGKDRRKKGQGQKLGESAGVAIHGVSVI